MTDDEIKAKITEHYQVELSHLRNTDTLADILNDRSDDGDDVDRAGRLLSGARIEIRWSPDGIDAARPKFAVDQRVQLMVCAEVVDVVITGVSQVGSAAGFNYAIQDSNGNLASCWEHELRVATTGSDAR